jgi:hypothetical protein
MEMYLSIFHLDKVSALDHTSDFSFFKSVGLMGLADQDPSTAGNSTTFFSR